MDTISKHKSTLEKGKFSHLEVKANLIKERETCKSEENLYRRQNIDDRRGKVELKSKEISLKSYVSSL